MKVFRALLVLTVGLSLVFISCPGEPYPPTEVVVAFEAVRDATLGPVNAELFDETTGIPTGVPFDIRWPNDAPDTYSLYYIGTLTETDMGGDNTLLEYDITITADNLSHSGYTISGEIDMTMVLTLDVAGSMTLTLNGGPLNLSGGDINTIMVNNVIIANGEELGTITFDGETYPASEFSFLPGT